MQFKNSIQDFHPLFLLKKSSVINNGQAMLDLGRGQGCGLNLLSIVRNIMPAKKNEGAKKMTEEELLLLESSRHVSMATSALFYGNAFIVSVLPLCK